VIESHGLLHAHSRLRWLAPHAVLSSRPGHRLDQESAGQIPENMIGTFLDNGDLRKLHRMLIRKKPSAPSVRRREASKRRIGKIMTCRHARRCGGLAHRDLVRLSRAKVSDGTGRSLVVIAFVNLSLPFLPRWDASEVSAPV
jgi:hypothetical protein